MVDEPRNGCLQIPWYFHFIRAAFWEKNKPGTLVACWVSEVGRCQFINIYFFYIISFVERSRGLLKTLVTCFQDIISLADFSQMILELRMHIYHPLCTTKSLQWFELFSCQWRNWGCPRNLSSFCPYRFLSQMVLLAKVQLDVLLVLGQMSHMWGVQMVVLCSMSCCCPSSSWWTKRIREQLPIAS